MDWLGAALGIAGDLFGQNSALDAQMAMLDKQMDFNREVMQNRHQWEVGDLRQAGLNPLMSVASPTGTLSAPTPGNVPKMNLAQSAAAMSQVGLNKAMADAALTNADANKISAEAEMIKANNDTNRTNFSMGPEFELKTQITNAQMDNLIAQSGLANSQAALNLLQKEWLPKLMKANLDEVQMKIATGYLVAKAQDYALRTGADAQMLSAQAASVSASAHVMQGQAALSQAASYDRFVANAEMLGVHEAALKDRQGYQALETANHLISKTEAQRRYNRYESEYEDDWLYRESRYEGRVVGNMADFFNSATRFVGH